MDPAWRGKFLRISGSAGLRSLVCGDVTKINPGSRSALRRTRMCYFRPPGNDAASIEILSCGKPGLLAACRLNHFMLRADRSDMDMHGPSALPCKFS